MRTKHNSITSTFKVEFIASFECKTLAFFIFQLSDDVVVKAVHSTTSESAFIESGSGSASGSNSGYPSPDEDDSNEEQFLKQDDGDSDEQPVLQESEDANKKITDYPAN